MNDELDKLLCTVDCTAPADFQARVMGQVASLPPPHSRPRPRWKSLAQRFALVAATAIGASHAIAFIFSLWIASSAAAN